MKAHCRLCQKEQPVKFSLMQKYMEVVLRCVQCGHRNFEAESFNALDVQKKTAEERAIKKAIEQRREKLKTKLTDKQKIQLEYEIEQMVKASLGEY